MSDYSDLIASLNPVRYARCDEASAGVLHDSSTFAAHGTTESGAIFGLGSAVETDPASTSIGGPVGRLPAALGSEADLKGAFTWLYWIFYDAAFPSGMALCRRGQFSLSHSVQSGINENNIFAEVTLENGGIGDDFPLTATTTLTDQHWYMVAVTRNGNVFRLYVNSDLGQGNERTDLTTADVDYNVDGTDWFLGRSVNTSAFASTKLDEVALFDYALNATQIRQIYETAMLTLFSSATIRVRTQVLLDTDAPEPVDFPFAHNWTEPISGSERVITEHLSWKTHSNQSEPDYQQRINARPRGPRRALEYAITPTSALVKAALQRTLWQPAQVFKLPIWTDWMPLDAPVAPTDTTLTCDTTLRDFEIGSYCTIASDPYDPATYQSFTITSRTDSQLGISPAVGAAVDGFVAPARLACLPAEESQAESYVVDLETASLTFEILDTELSSRRVTTYTPTSTYQPNGSKPAVEVFSLDSARFDILEQQQYAMRQRQLGTGNPTGNDYYRGLDTATTTTIPMRVLLTTREQLSSFFGWLNARQGKQNPVWVASNENDLTFHSHVGGTAIKIKSGYAFYNLHYSRRDIQVTFTNGTTQNARINSFVDNNDGTETLTLSVLSSGSVAKISWLRFCVAPDSFELRYHRDLTTAGNMIVECAWEFTELLTTP